MKEKLRELLEKCIENGSKEDLSAIDYLLSGIKKKIEFNNDSFIGRLLYMERNGDRDFYEVTIPLNPVLNNNLGILHGGITATVLDTAMGILANNNSPKGSGAVTNQLNIHYLAPGTGEFLRCLAKVVHQGTKTMVISGEAFRDDGKKIAHATGTFFIINL